MLRAFDAVVACKSFQIVLFVYSQWGISQASMAKLSLRVCFICFFMSYCLACVISFFLAFLYTVCDLYFVVDTVDPWKNVVIVIDQKILA